ncbi:MAG: hypothetical protein AMXMBFR36_27940 [Acidobacteriota bacterium]
MKAPTDAALLRRVVYSMQDVYEARLMLCFAESEIPEVRQDLRGRMVRLTRLWGLYSAAVVAYCRPFTRSEKGEFAARRLPKDEFERRLDKIELLDTHHRIIATRDRLIAHGDPHTRRLSITGSRTGSKSRSILA